MGGAAKSIASVATLGLSDAVLGATATPGTSTSSVDSVDNNKVSDANVESYNTDKKRRAQAAGLSSTILGGAAAAPATTATKTLLGA
jgi:hypothetical protein